MPRTTTTSTAKREKDCEAASSSIHSPSVVSSSHTSVAVRQHQQQHPKQRRATTTKKGRQPQRSSLSSSSDNDKNTMNHSVLSAFRSNADGHPYHRHNSKKNARSRVSSVASPPRPPLSSFISTKPSIPSPSSSTYPTRQEMDLIFGMCRKDDWEQVLHCVRRNPQVTITPMIMDNHISTTIIHQAITSKGGIIPRARVIQTVLSVQPMAAAIKNGYGSLPLHVIAQRNTKMTADFKEQLIYDLVQAYPEGLAEEGGVGRRTPIHVLFTDYISLRLTRLMIESCPEATFMKDKKGYLPAHVACSRHCSPQKLHVLLLANPAALYATTNEGHDLLWLAKTTATKSHPNYALIDALKTALRERPNPNPRSPTKINNNTVVLKSAAVAKQPKGDEDYTTRHVNNDPSSSPRTRASSTRRLRSAALCKSNSSSNALTTTAPTTTAPTNDDNDGAVDVALEIAPSVPSSIPAVSSRSTTPPPPPQVLVELTSPSSTKSPSPTTNLQTPSLPPRRSRPSNLSSISTSHSLYIHDDTTPTAANLLLHFHRNGSPELKHSRSEEEPLASPSQQQQPSPTSFFHIMPVPKRRKLMHSSQHDIHNTTITNSLHHDETLWSHTRIAEV